MGLAGAGRQHGAGPCAGAGAPGSVRVRAGARTLPPDPAEPLTGSRADAWPTRAARGSSHHVEEQPSMAMPVVLTGILRAVASDVGSGSCRYLGLYNGA
ncbi:hypothetical protein G6F24_015123 [Rhizopus arrhizus]|nr:hypothetical protein G6F24_015123 [Rhizopus arrhizus]